MRTIDPNWREPAGFHTTAEGMINHLRYVARTADARFAELTGYQLNRIPDLGPPLRLDPAPVIPQFRPPTVQEENIIARQVAEWLNRNPVSRLGELAGPRSWIYEHQARIEAYLEPPRTLEELRGPVGSRRKGHDDHHIREKTPARQDGFSTNLIEARENKVNIPTFRHWDITGWFARKNPDYDWMSPRDFLRGKEWHVRMRLGLDAMIDAGVLKP